jgi:hypothetical protein
MALASWAALGTGTWIAFWHNLSIASTTYLNYPSLWRRMPTVFIAARSAGLDYLPAMILQLISALGVMGAIAWMWATGKPAPLRMASLTIGTLLTVPFAFEYDLTLVGLAFAWLGWEDYCSHNGKGLVILGYFWLAFFLTGFGMIGNKFVQPYPWILAIMLIYVLFRARSISQTLSPVATGNLGGHLS